MPRRAGSGVCRPGPRGRYARGGSGTNGMMGPMRLVSLLPSATEIVYALGLGDELVGVTFECDQPPRPARGDRRSGRAPAQATGGRAGMGRPTLHRRALGTGLVLRDTWRTGSRPPRYPVGAALTMQYVRNVLVNDPTGAASSARQRRRTRHPASCRRSGTPWR